jgi:hypothetical protein
MAFGPGKYDPECTEIRARLKAHGVLLMVFSGDRGSGFAAQLTPEMTMNLPKILRGIADEIERSGIDA